MYRLMIVDDEPIVIKAISHIISNNFDNLEICTTTEDGVKAVQLARENKPDIIFMDIKLKGINGLDSIQEIRKFLPKTIIIIISAYDIFSYAQKAIKVGIMDYLLKPINKKDIITILDRAIETLEKQREENRELLLLKEKLKENKPNIYSFQPPWKMEKKLFKSVKLGNTRQVQQNLRHIINYLKKDATFQQLKQYLLELCGVVLRLSYDYIPASKVKKLNYNILRERINNTLTIKESVEVMEEIVKNITRLIDDYLTEDIHPVLKKAKKYIDKNYNQDLTLENIADYVAISPNYLSKLFKDQFNINLIDYLTRVRINKSLELLHETRLPIKEIAKKVGYHDPNYFSKVFKKITGQRPSDKRR